MMVGRDVTLMKVAAGRRALSTGETDDSAAQPVLEVKGLSADGDRGTPALDDVGFKVGAGEIVSIVGVEGNGQSELEEVLYGLRAPRAGTVALAGRDITRAEPRERLRRGLGLVPSDRYRRGVYRDGRVSWASGGSRWSPGWQIPSCNMRWDRSFTSRGA